MGKGSWLEKLGLSRKPPASLEEFRDSAAKALQRLRPEVRIETRASDILELQWPNKPEALPFSVREPYDLWLTDPRYLDLAVERIALLMAISGDVPTAEALFVFVEPADEFADVDASDPLLVRAVAGGFAATVVVDTPYGYQSLAGSLLREELGMTDAQVWDRALANSIEKLDVGNVPLDAREGTALLRDDGLATTLLLVDSFWDPPRQQDVLIAGPINPNKLIVATYSDRSVRLMRREMERDPLDRERWRHSRDILIRRNGRWEVLH